MEPARIIGQNISHLRNSNGIKQENLARHLGITKGRMSQIEFGDCHEITLNRLQKIANYIGVNFFELFTPPQNPKIDK